MYCTIVGCTKKNRMIRLAIILGVFFDCCDCLLLQKYQVQNM